MDGIAEEAVETITEGADDAGGIAENQDGGASDDGGGISEKPDGGKKDAKPGGAGNEGGKPGAGGEKPAADWVLEAPADFPIPEENLKDFTEAAKRLGMSREQAAGMVEWHKAFTEKVNAANEQAKRNELAGWRDEIMKDADFGGANFKRTVADARKALRTFDPDGKLSALLRDSGWQNNPDVIRVVARVGKAMGEHEFFGSGGGGRDSRPLFERIYKD